MGLFKHKSAIIKLGEKNIEVRNRNEAEFYASQFLKHCNDSTEIINKTKKPDVFFDRYNFLLQETKNLVELEIFSIFKGKTPSNTLQHLISVKEHETNLMIERSYEDLKIKLDKLKTSNSKQNNIDKLFELFNMYSEEMTKSNIDLYTYYHNTFISNI